MAKILVVKYGFNDDSILTVPFLRNLRRAYPDARIDMLVQQVAGEILEGCPYIDNFIHPGRKSKIGLTSFSKYVKELKKVGYHKVYVLDRSFVSTVLVYQANIPERIGFKSIYSRFMFTNAVVYNKDKHELECFLDLLTADNIPVEDNYLENWINPKSSAKINDVFREYNIREIPKVLVQVTSHHKNNQWPLEYFAKVIEYLVNTRNIQVFYVGTSQEYSIYNEIHNLIKSRLKIKPVNLCGKISFQDNIALIKRMDLAFGTNSGNLHIAASLNVLVVGIYGPMSLKKWRVYGQGHTCFVDDLSCIPCDLQKNVLLILPVLRNVSPDMVIPSLDAQLDRLANYYK